NMELLEGGVGVDETAIPVLNIDPERLRKEDDRQFWESSAAAAAGGVGGGALGTLLVNPLEYRADRVAERQAIKMREYFLRNREILETMRDLHSGKKTWDDIEPEAVEPLREQMKAHQDLLKDRAAMSEALREKPPAEVRFLPGAQRLSLKRLL